MIEFKSLDTSDRLQLFGNMDKVVLEDLYYYYYRDNAPWIIMQHMIPNDFHHPKL